MKVLSKLPALRDLNLAFNYFTGVKLRPEAVECAFPLLEALDLGFNYIGNESDVVVVVLFERLQTVILYGNPLAGPTGEDSLGLCVENLVVESDRQALSIFALCAGGARSGETACVGVAAKTSAGFEVILCRIIGECSLPGIYFIQRLLGAASQIEKGGRGALNGRLRRFAG